MNALTLLGTTLGLAFLSGINLYATILTIGLGLRFGVIDLSTELQGLEILSHTTVLLASAILYLIEFLADKIPWIDSAWDAIHTFIRPVGAAAIGFMAVGNVRPEIEILMTLASGGTGLFSHLTKAGTRLAVNQSPEPFSNGILSTVEDIFVVFCTWLFIAHPLIGLTVVGLFLAIFCWVAPKIYRVVRLQFAALLGLIRSLLASADSIPKSDGVLPIPKGLQPLTSKFLGTNPQAVIIRCYSGKGALPGHFFAGVLCLSPQGGVFVTKRFLKARAYELSLRGGLHTECRHHLFLSRLFVQTLRGQECYYYTRDKQSQVNELVNPLSRIIDLTGNVISTNANGQT